MGLSCRTCCEEPLGVPMCFPSGALQTLAPNPYMRVPETPPVASPQKSLGRGSRFGEHRPRRARARKAAMKRCALCYRKLGPPSATYARLEYTTGTRCAAANRMTAGTVDACSVKHAMRWPRSGSEFGRRWRATRRPSGADHEEIDERAALYSAKDRAQDRGQARAR
jgi:hypothetical protein